MKKIIALSSAALVLLAVTSCGGGGHGPCPAYQKYDYTKYKAEKQKDLKLNKKYKRK